MFVTCVANQFCQSVNLFKSVLSFSGFPIRRAEKDIQAILKNLQNEDRHDYTEKRKWEIFNYHLTHNDAYFKFVEGKKPDIWHEVPIMTKQDLQKPLADRISEDYTSKQLFVNKTSGSSGNPFIFAKDKYAHALTWAHILWLYSNYGITLGKSLEARYYGIPKDFKPRLKERAKDFFARRYRFDIFDLSDNKLDKMIETYRHKPFKYINGYTSSIVMLAKHLKSKQLILKEICPSLKFCIATSEMLFPEDRKAIEDYIGVPVINEYGASELDIIAFENTEGNWILNDKTLFTEVVDDNNLPVADGEEGHLVITSLYNRGHPFIRYKIGDVGVIKQTDKNGTPQLKKLIGRTNEFAFLPSGKRVPALTFYYVTKSLIEDKGAVKEIKVIQDKKDTFTVEYVADHELKDEETSRITQAIEDYLEPGLHIKYSRKHQLERSKSGKLKQFISKVS